MVFSLGYWSLFNTAFTFHIVSIYGELGISASEAVKIFLPISIISVLSRFLGSFLSDRIPIKYIYIVYGISLIIASVAMLSLHTTLGTLLVIIGYGIGSGLFGMLNIVTWPKLYGRKHLGAVSGFAMSIIVAGSAIGPWIFSMVQRFTHSYQNTGLYGMVISSILLLAIIIIPFQKKD
ncbi:MAG: MFS transporter [Sphaerochaetaceae bacterium]